MIDYFNAFTSNVLDYLDEGVYFTDINKNIIYWNSGAENILGYRAEETTMQKCCQIISHMSINGEKRCGEHCSITKAFQEGRQQKEDMFITHKDGHLIFATVKTFPVYNKYGHLLGVIELFSDNSQKKIGHDKVKALTKAAYMDSLSELFSKQYIESRLQTMLNEIPEKRESFGILYINIVSFRAINELYGVSRADKILKMLAKTLSSCITYPAIIGRWHGASFIAIADSSKKSLLLMLADKIKRVVAEAIFPINEENFQVTVTIGYAIAQSYDSMDYLIERATKNTLEEKDKDAADVPPAVNTAPTIATQRNKTGFYSNMSKSDSTR
ncbi:sensor domain-containing diguanylate cyclase [Sporomusa malonica]|uniref:PAS domain S-box-containing protein/diguanylate cyclase (GGDEF) domain-containing protein n=1 Tax=Sporomusa malonica TaxID=112901 RepID=A0A1W2DZQ5_9FIRM|nr:sensor domain-containing diguanylate cyclase [Sporomusa malonica]SMD02592.1 PAS domain S-box-containing protein/diguanylate cyclase (GGDEF) domain-containing protein [Sporomusa malonica]